MPLTFDRTAQRLKHLHFIAIVAGFLLWSTWLGGILLGGSQTKPDFPYLVLGAPNGERDMLGLIVSVDHLAFYSPARMIRDGRSGEIYDHRTIHQYQQEIFHPRPWDSLEAYRNPPFYALLYMPTTGLSYTTSVWIWSGVSLVLLMLGLRSLQPARFWVAFGWVLTFLPVFASFSYGQNSVVSFAVFCGTFRLLLARRPFLAGLVAGLLWFKPPLLIGLVLWGLLDIRRLWPAAFGVVVSGLLLSGGSYLIIPDAWDAFFRTLTENAKFDNFEWWKMHNPRAFWRLLLPGVPVAPTVLWLLCVALGVVWFWKIWSRNRENIPVVFGASVLLMLWASPHTMIYEWAIAVVPAILWWVHVPRYRSTLFVLYAIVGVILFVSTDAGRAQVWIEEKKLGMSPTIIFQFSVPILGWVGWHAMKILTRPPEVQSQRPIDEIPPVATGSGP